MELNTKLRYVLQLGVVHGLSSAVVIALKWSSIERHFSRHSISFVCSYVVTSIIFIGFSGLMCGRLKRIGWAAAVPYFSAVLAYGVLAFYWFIGRSQNGSYENVVGAVVIMWLWPFLAMSGWLVSLVNVCVMAILSTRKAMGWTPPS